MLSYPRKSFLEKNKSSASPISICWCKILPQLSNKKFSMEWSFSDWTRNPMDFFCLIPNYIFSLIPKWSSVPWTRNRIGSCPLGGILKHISSQDNFILILRSLSSHEKIHSRVLLVPLPQQFPSFGAFILMPIYYWGNFYPQASLVLVEFKKFGSNAKISCAHFFIIFNHACIYNKYTINI